MRDADVRSAVLHGLALQHANDPDTRVVQEMGVWSGSVRIDVAVINGELCGFELKSDRDTLERLPAQAELYSRVFDRVTLVVGSKHQGKARRVIPRWWGVIEATAAPEGVRLMLRREAQRNPNPDPVMLARLLWRDEALVALEGLGAADGVRSKSASAVHQRLAESVTVAQLSAIVRDTLKARTGWLGQAFGDQRQVPVHADLHPSLPTAGGGASARGGDLLDFIIAPTYR